MIEPSNFAEEIEANKNASKAPVEAAVLETEASELKVRLRGAYITKCELTSPTSGRRVAVLYSDSDIAKAKISATHSMVPAGPYAGIGGQHGFARWADYDIVPQDGRKQLELHARRSDQGIALTKRFELSPSTLTINTAIELDGGIEHTSMGEHIYFCLEDEKLEGLKVNGSSLDELLGEGSEDAVRNGGALYWDFGGEAVIDFPAGHSIKLAAAFSGESKYPLAMWIWKRPGSPSICFEPVAGVKGLGQEDNSGVTLAPGAPAQLSAKIALL